MLNVAMLSRWHVHADGYAGGIAGAPDARVSCVWDEDAERGANWARELGAPFEADIDALLKRSDVDAVAINSPTSMHRELMLKSARAGKHIFTEKCMCLTVADCDEVIAAIEKNGVKFCISFPQRAKPRNIYVKRAVDSGMLGEITLLRARKAHDGALADWLPEYWFDPATTGGGAMMDHGAHPMYLASWILGRPTRVQAMFNALTGRAIDDNAVCLMEFENRAIAVVESSLVSPASPAVLEVYGTKGAIIAVDDDVRLRTIESAASLENGGWLRPKLPEAPPNPLRQWLNGILYGGEILYGPREGRELTELMERAYQACEAGREVAF